jgi:hypothetical protein
LQEFIAEAFYDLWIGRGLQALCDVWIGRGLPAFCDLWIGRGLPVFLSSRVSAHKSRPACN